MIALILILFTVSFQGVSGSNEDSGVDTAELPPAKSKDELKAEKQRQLEVEREKKKRQAEKDRLRKRKKQVM